MAAKNPSEPSESGATPPKPRTLAKTQLTRLRRNLHTLSMAMRQTLVVRPLEGLSSGEISPEQLRVLRLLIVNEGIRVGEVAEALGIKPSSASLILDRMVTGRFVERFSDTEDRRVQRVRATALGQNIFQEAEVIADRKLVNALSEMEETEVKQLVRLTGALTRGLMKEEDFFANLCFHCGIQSSGDCGLDMQFKACPYRKARAMA